MVQLPSLAESFHDAALGKLKQKILWQAQKHGRLVLTCGRFTKSTNTCSVCHTPRAEKLAMDERSWTCPVCHTLLDRDINAAKVILLEALKSAEKQLLSYQQEHSTVPGKGARTSIPWTGLHPALSKFIARGGLTSLLEIYSSESQQQVVSSPAGSVAGETRIPSRSQPKRYGTAKAG